MKCPKCQFENPENTEYCGKCGTQFDADIDPTKTVETPTEELTTGSTFAGRYQIIYSFYSLLKQNHYPLKALIIED